MKSRILVLYLLFFVPTTLFGQESNGKVIIAKYKLYPYSSTFFNHDNATPSDKKEFDIALRRTKEFKYTLMSNFNSSQAIFFLDTIITTPIAGKEEYWIEPENVLHFSYKKDDVHHKKESIFNTPFYTIIDENEFSYEWEITDEKKVIAGFNCVKAISNIRNNKMTAWFTPDLPISYGPLNLYGLPGLIVEAENFFNTITIESIQYAENENLLNSELSKIKTSFDNEKGDDEELKESIFLIKKSGLINQLKMMN